MKPQIEAELLAEMTLFPPAANPPAVTRRAPEVQFTQEQLEEARRTNPWVAMNAIPQVAVHSKAPPMTNRQRTRGR